MTAQEIQFEALSRARGNLTCSNYPAIYHGFLAKGIAEDDIKPRENIFTFHAWKALGRQVKKGEHGVKVTTWREYVKETEDPNTGEIKRKVGRSPWTATVFHISQTEIIAS